MIVKITDLDIGKPVLYVPNHANGDLNHPDVEEGVIAEFNNKFIFVRFPRNVSNSEACDPKDLYFKPDDWKPSEKRDKPIAEDEDYEDYKPIKNTEAYDKFASKFFSPDPINEEVPDRGTQECQLCGAEFIPSSSKPKLMFCSVECSHKALPSVDELRGSKYGVGDRVEVNVLGAWKEGFIADTTPGAHVVKVVDEEGNVTKVITEEESVRHVA